MKRMALMVALLVLVSAISAPVSANPTPRTVRTALDLSFSGTTANCFCQVVEDSPSAYLVVTMKLWSGNTVLKQWSQAGAGSVSISKTAAVTEGQTYKLTVDVMVNGASRPQYSVTKTC